MRPCSRYTKAVPAFLLVWLALISPALAAEKPTLWKPAEQPLLRLDDRPVVEWNVYLAGKKLNPLLVAMNGRYLLIDQQAETVFEIPARKVVKHGADVYCDPADKPDKPLETSEWIVKDVGSAYRVHMKLVVEGHVLDVQIPHPLDLRPIHPF